MLGYKVCAYAYSAKQDCLKLVEIQDDIVRQGAGAHYVITLSWTCDIENNFKTQKMCTYCVMAAGRIHCEFKRIAVEMFARVRRVDGS